MPRELSGPRDTRRLRGEASIFSAHASFNSLSSRLPSQPNQESATRNAAQTEKTGGGERHRFQYGPEPGKSIYRDACSAFTNCNSSSLSKRARDNTGAARSRKCDSAAASQRAGARGTGTARSRDCDSARGTRGAGRAAHD